MLHMRPARRKEIFVEFRNKTGGALEVQRDSVSWYFDKCHCRDFDKGGVRERTTRQEPVCRDVVGNGLLLCISKDSLMSTMHFKGPGRPNRILILLLFPSYIR
jgi:hypothetical protein